MKKKVAFNVNELVEEILEHRRLYYSGSPVISDDKYDKLEEKLQPHVNKLIEEILVGISKEHRRLKEDESI